jgi:hypothetical protein
MARTGADRLRTRRRDQSLARCPSSSPNVATASVISATGTRSCRISRLRIGSSSSASAPTSPESLAPAPSTYARESRTASAVLSSEVGSGHRAARLRRSAWRRRACCWSAKWGRPDLNHRPSGSPAESRSASMRPWATPASPTSTALDVVSGYDGTLEVRTGDRRLLCREESPPRPQHGIPPR